MIQLGGDSPPVLFQKTEEDFKRLVLASRVYSIARGQWRKIDDMAPPPVAVVRDELLEDDFASEISTSDLRELTGAETDYTDTFLLVLRGAVMDEVPFHADSGISMQEVFKECVAFFSRSAPRPLVRRLMVAPIIDKAIQDLNNIINIWKDTSGDFAMLYEGMLQVSKQSDSMRSRGRAYKPKKPLDETTVRMLTQTGPVREVSLSEDD